MSRRTIIQSVSFQPDVWDYLESKPVSSIVNEAVRLHKKTMTTKELKIKYLKEQKREHSKKMNELDEEIKRLMED